MTNPLRSHQDLQEPIEPRKLSDFSPLLLEMQWSVSSERVKESSLTDVQVAEVTELWQWQWWPELSFLLFCLRLRTSLCVLRILPLKPHHAQESLGMIYLFFLNKYSLGTSCMQTVSASSFPPLSLSSPKFMTSSLIIIVLHTHPHTLTHTYTHMCKQMAACTHWCMPTHKHVYTTVSLADHVVLDRLCGNSFLEKIKAYL